MRCLGDTLEAGKSMINGDCLISAGGLFQLNVLDYDVQIPSSGPPWWRAASSWAGFPRDQYTLTMQDDGNLVLYSSTSKPVWASQTSTGGRGCRAVLNYSIGGEISFVILNKDNTIIWHADIRPFDSKLDEGEVKKPNENKVDSLSSSSSTGSRQISHNKFTSPIISMKMFAQWLEYAIRMRDDISTPILKYEQLGISNELYHEILRMQLEQKMRQGDNIGSQQTLSSLTKKSKEAINLISKVKKFGLYPKETAYRGGSFYGSFCDQLNERKLNQDKIYTSDKLCTTACEFIANDLIEKGSPESYGIQSAQASSFITKLLMSEGFLQCELELRALARALQVVVVVLYSDGKNSERKEGPDIYKPTGSSKKTPIITLGYIRGVYSYHSLSNLKEKFKAFQNLVKLVQGAEEDKKPLSDNKSIIPVKVDRVPTAEGYSSNSHGDSSSSPSMFSTTRAPSSPPSQTVGSTEENKKIITLGEFQHIPAMHSHSSDSRNNSSSSSSTSSTSRAASTPVSWPSLQNTVPQMLMPPPLSGPQNKTTVIHSSPTTGGLTK